MIMAFYNYRGLEFKKKKKGKPCFYLFVFSFFFVFHTDTALICIVFLAASLKIQILSAKEQQVGFFKLRNVQMFFTMLYYAYKTNQLPAWPCSGTRLAILHPENASHVSIWVAACVLFIDVCIQSTLKIVCSCDVNCFRCKTCPYVINCR